MSLGLAFDTETTGVLNKLPRNHPSQPDMVQLGCILFDDQTGEIHASVDILVENTVPIEPKAQEIHGKTPELLKKAGINRRSALSIFHGMLLKADFILAHNLAFDLGILHIAYIRENIQPDHLLSKPSHCTMLMTTDLMKLPNVKYPNLGYKWPSLDEAYRKFVDPNGFEGAHDAMADITACMKIFMNLKNKDDTR